LSNEVGSELRGLQDLLQGVKLSEVDDERNITSTKSGEIIPNKVYKLSFRHILSHFPSQWIWKSKCTSKHKFFAWLILYDHINTKYMLRRRHWNATSDHDCVLCHNHCLEDWSHLFYECTFIVEVWIYLQINWAQGSGPDVKEHQEKIQRPIFY
jgi:hypothetical protein